MDGSGIENATRSRLAPGGLCYISTATVLSLLMPSGNAFPQLHRFLPLAQLALSSISNRAFPTPLMLLPQHRSLLPGLISFLLHLIHPRTSLISTHFSLISNPHLPFFTGMPTFPSSCAAPAPFSCQGMSKRTRGTRICERTKE